MSTSREQVEYIYQPACVAHLQTSLWPQPWLCQSEPAHPEAVAGQRTPAAVKHITITSSKNPVINSAPGRSFSKIYILNTLFLYKTNYISSKTNKHWLSKEDTNSNREIIIRHTSLMMLRLAWSRGAGLPACLKRRCRAFSLSSHWAAALLWDLWISCRWSCSRSD